LNIDIGAEVIDKLSVNILNNVEPGTYTGRIYVTSEGRSQSLPFTISISMKGATVLEITVETKNLNKRVDLNGTAKFQFFLYDLGFRKRFNVNLDYRIKDFQTEKLIYNESELKDIKDDKHIFTLLNFPNCDMVGHTGDLKAAIKAVETVDKCVGKLVEANYDRNSITIITADHGNAEKMWDSENNLPHTAHTTNIVPFIVLNYDKNEKIKDKGRLADIAPTVLYLLGIPNPKEMTGENLLY
jgi:membrane-anchored protein YejM (alkaline phosphatase superfamily)